MDFTNENRSSFSYVIMPKHYPSYCSNADELSKSVLNTSIVSVPHGSEHTSFMILKKN